MRFDIGKIPPNDDFQPEEGGWLKCREPSFPVFLLLSVPIAVVLVSAANVAVASIGGGSSLFSMRPDDSPFKLLLLLGMLGGTFLITILLHEAAHVLGHPKMGSSADTIVGVSPRHFVAFAAFDNEIGRNRFLMMVSLPLVLLSVVPITVFALYGAVNTWLAWVAILNALGSSFDVLAVIIVIVQIPSDAVMRNNGWETYWKKQTDDDKKGNAK